DQRSGGRELLPRDMLDQLLADKTAALEPDAIQPTRRQHDPALVVLAVRGLLDAGAVVDRDLDIEITADRQPERLRRHATPCFRRARSEPGLRRRPRSGTGRGAVAATRISPSRDARPRT